MAQTKSIAVDAPRLKSKKSEVYTFTNKKKSTYQKQSYKDEKNPNSGIFLDSAKFAYLPLESFTYAGKDGEEGRVDTMFIRGAATIFKDDLYLDKEGIYHTIMSVDEKEAEKKGWVLKRGLVTLKRIDTERKLKEHLAAGKRMRIGFESGLMSLDKYGNDENLKRFIKYHHQNTKSPNFRAPAYSLFLFAPIEEEKVAESEIGPIETEAQVMNYITSLRTTAGNKFQYTEANKKKVDATLILFDMQNFQEENYTQKHQAISTYAKANPELFMEIIESGFGEKKMTIATALHETIKVIAYDKKEGTFTLITGEKEGKPTKRLLLTCESGDFDAQTEELVAHFIVNPTDWRDTVLLVEAAKGK